MAALVALAMSAATHANAQALEKIVIGTVPALPSAGTYIADAKGYFRDSGIAVDLESLGSAADVVAMLASNRMQVVEGGYSAGYWNALTQNLPIIMAFERGSAPLAHKIVIAADRKNEIKTAADLKGRTLALNAPGTLGFWEVDQVLASVGLTVKDIEVKYLPFTQMALALTNHAVDAAEDIPPFSTVAFEQNLIAELTDNDKIIKPYPYATVAYQINTDWAAKNQELVRKFFIAVARGTREYCQAYHHGANRSEVVDILMKYKVMSDRALLERMPWQGRQPSGRLDGATALSIQDTYFKLGMITKKFPVERLIEQSYADYVERQLGTFVVENKSDTLDGCR